MKQSATKVEPPHKPKVIGYLRGDISGIRLVHHTDEIRLLAGRLGFHLVYTVRLWPSSVPDPLRHVLAIVEELDATALLVPDLAHVDNQPAVVCDVCELITAIPEQVWARTERQRSSLRGRIGEADASRLLAQGGLVEAAGISKLHPSMAISNDEGHKQ